MKTKIFISVAVLALAGFLTACDKDGPMENAGEKIDNAVDEAKDKIDDANQGPVEKAGEAVDETIEKIKEKAEDAKESMQDSSK